MFFKKDGKKIGKLKYLWETTDVIVTLYLTHTVITIYLSLTGK